MLRPALLALSATVALLVTLSLLPQRERTVPGGTIALRGAQVTLYPQADPEAVWNFAAERVDYEPDTGESVLYAIADAERTVGGETDFTLASEQITIDAQENLRGQRIQAHLLEANWDLDMQGVGDRQVLIDQVQGRFEVPLLDYRGDGIGESRDQNVSMTFDLKGFSAGGPDTVGYNRFIDASDQP